MLTPIAVASGIGCTGRNGVLIKGGIHLKNLEQVETIAFDKTGTIEDVKYVCLTHSQIDYKLSSVENM